MTVLIFTILSVLSGIFALASRVLIALAINYDCRSRNLKSTTLFTILSFFFPLIVGIIYAGTRDSAEPNEKYCTTCNVRVDGAAKVCPNCNTFTLAAIPKPDAKKLAKTGVTLCIIGIVIYALCIGTGVARTVIAVKAGLDIADNYSEEDIEKWADKFIEDYLDDEEETTEEADDEEDTTEDIESILGNLKYYDRNGKAYDSPDKVPFYDRDGNAYFFKQDKDLNSWYEIENSGEKLESEKCFVDKDGYFIYDDKGEITFGDDMFVAYDKDGNKYSPASLVIWNKDGKMIGTID